MIDSPRATTILFADLAGSTGLYERLGDDAAHATVSHALACWSEIVARHGGRVVKTMGDGLFAVLPDPTRAASAAEAFHSALDTDELSRAANLTGRVALHLGAVLERDGDVFGDAVNVAARLVALAKPRQILISGETADPLRATAGGQLQSLGPTRVKGRATELELFEWVWERAMVTVLVNSAVSSGTAESLLVSAGGSTVRVTPERPRITIGRQAFNDLVVDEARVSRLHARIELRGTRFILCDESSNGTHLLPFAGKPAVLRREEGDLGRMGFFGLGDEPAPGTPHTVEYRVESMAGDPTATAT